MKPDKKPDNPQVFPEPYLNSPDLSLSCRKGMDLLSYFIAHAPPTPQWDFDVPMDIKRPDPINKGYETDVWDNEKKKKRIKMWPAEWARVQLEERLKHLDEEPKKNNHG